MKIDIEFLKEKLDDLYRPFGWLMPRISGGSSSQVCNTLNTRPKGFSIKLNGPA